MNVMNNMVLYRIINSIQSIVFIVILMLFYSCSNHNSEQNKPTITVSILPQKYFIEQISQDIFNIEVLIPPGASPATYDPTPQQLMNISNSKLYFRIGHIEFEKKWTKALTEQNPNLKIINCSDGIKLIDALHNDEHGHEGIDPHTWMSPKNVKIITDNIYKELLQLNDQNDSLITTNYLRFMNRIDSLNGLISDKMSKIQNRSFIIYHPALTYFSKDYDLTQIIIEMEGKEPSPFHMKELVSKAKTEGITTIFIQRQFDMAKAETIAKELNGRLVPIDPLDYNWENQIIEITKKLSFQQSKN